MTTFIDQQKIVYDTPITNLNSNLAENTKWNLVRGASKTQYYSQPAVSSSDTTNIIFNVIPPSVTSIIDRKMLVQTKWRITLGCDAAAGTDTFLNYDGDAPRFMGVTQSCSSQQVIINGYNNNSQVFQYAEPMMRFNEMVERDKNQFLSLFPSMQDNWGSYSGTAPTILGGGVGGQNNPLSSYTNSKFGASIGRGAWPVTFYLTGTDTKDPKQTYQKDTVANVENKRDIVFEVIEPLIISPCQFSSFDKAGLIGIENLSINLQMNGLTKFLWSHAAGVGTSKPLNPALTVVKFEGVPNLLINYLTPQVSTIDYLISQTHLYELFRPDYFTSSTVTATAVDPNGPGASVTSQTIQFSSIPQRIYIFARATQDTKDISSSDTYLSFIEKSINIVFNNDSSILNNISNAELYALSVKNGLKYSYVEWNKQIGHIVCLDATDLNLGPELCAGRTGNFQFTVTARVRNEIGMPATNSTILTNNPIVYTPYQYELKVIPVYVGQLIISDTVVLGQIGIADTSILTQNPEVAISNQYFYDMKHESSFYGAGVSDQLKKYSQRALSYANRALPYAKRGVQFVAKHGPAAVQAAEKGAEFLGHLLASGYSEEEAKKIMNGKGLVGGKGVNKSKLQKRLLM